MFSSDARNLFLLFSVFVRATSHPGAFLFTSESAPAEAYIMFSRNWPCTLDLQALLTDAVDLPGTAVDVGDCDLQPSDELMTVLMSGVPDALTPNEADMPGEFPDLSEHTESLFGSVVPLPETPSEPPEYHLLEPFCSNLPPFQAYMTPHSYPGGDSSQNVFRFPELDDGESTTPFPTVPVSQTGQCHEGVPAVFDTPPATPSTPQQGPPHPPPYRRERLGGVSMIRDEEFDFELDVPQEDMSVFPDTDSPAANDAATAGSSLGGREEGQEQEDHMQIGGGEPAEEERLDPRLAKAWEQSQGSKSIAPLLKEELRLKIQKKRVDTGQEELEVRFDKPRVYQVRVRHAASLFRPPGWPSG